MMIATRMLALATAVLFASVPNAQAGSVSGIVVDDTGAPVGGIHVDLVETHGAGKRPANGDGIKDTDITDTHGHYDIPTDTLPPGRYAVYAYQAMVFDGEERIVDFTADDSSTFTGDTDTIRNFRFIPAEDGR